MFPEPRALEQLPESCLAFAIEDASPQNDGPDLRLLRPVEASHHQVFHFAPFLVLRAWGGRTLLIVHVFQHAASGRKSSRPDHHRGNQHEGDVLRFGRVDDGLRGIRLRIHTQATDGKMEVLQLALKKVDDHKFARLQCLHELFVLFGIRSTAHGRYSWQGPLHHRNGRRVRAVQVSTKDAMGASTSPWVKLAHECRTQEGVHIVNEDPHEEPAEAPAKGRISNQTSARP
mmetsp:Transcript_18877/g.51960  ORF Transcript_18877/g.51960 Transcript_18877/m.51960 type:complete len:230 (+) Transcript_18877:1836-2525(+)